MRKIDYQILAKVIAHKRAEMHRVLSANTDEKTRLVAMAADQSARDVAEDFARKASVDKTAFLKACGIED